MDANRLYFAVATRDIHAAESWKYRDRRIYHADSYSHTALALATLERLLGRNVMDRALRLYADRWRFRHPTLGDFIAAVNETSGRDWTWYFDRTFFSSDDVDYAVEEARSMPSQPPRGLFEKEGKLVEGPPPELAKARGYDSVVTVTRRGGAALPVEILLRFEGGQHPSGALGRAGPMDAPDRLAGAEAPRSDRGPGREDPARLRPFQQRATRRRRPARGGALDLPHGLLGAEPSRLPDGGLVSPASRAPCFLRGLASLPLEAVLALVALAHPARPLLGPDPPDLQLAP